MNTIPADRGMVESFEGMGTLSWTDVQLRRERRIPSVKSTSKAAVAKPATTPAPGLWIGLQSHSGAERWLMLVLVLAAMVGIVYGFSCMTDLVHNWAAVNVGVDKLTH